MRWIVALVVAVVLACCVATTAHARPGGGHSYSGGSHSYGGSSHSSGSHSGGGGGDADTMVILLAVVFCIVVFVAVTARSDAATLSSSVAAIPANARDLQPLITLDPAFSQVAFEDFAFQLYARAQRARSNPAQLIALTPYVSSDLRARLVHAPAVTGVVIGSLRIISVTLADNGLTSVDVRIEANVVSTPTVNTVERWTFERAASAKTRTPDQTRTFPCPNCNAPFTRGESELTCAHCGTEIAPGRFDWTVTGIVVGALTTVGPTLTGTVPEVGNDLVTVVDPGAYTAIQALYEADHNVTWDAFSAHVTMIYSQLNTAWNAQDLTPVRGLVTSSLLGYLQYWIDEYKRQRLANRLEDAKIQRFALAKVSRDPSFDAITLRVFADGNDFTLDAGNAVVGGSKTARRAYTEYWTLVRSSTRRGPLALEPKCPNCSAPLSISDSGACTHCKAEVESGSFDWVLSKIEQDEVYRG